MKVTMILVLLAASLNVFAAAEAAGESQGGNDAQSICNDAVDGGERGSKDAPAKPVKGATGSSAEGGQ